MTVDGLRSARAAVAGLPQKVALGAGAAFMGTALATGWWLGDRSDGRERIRTAEVELELPAGWQRVPRAPSVPGISAETMTAYAPDADAERGALMVGSQPAHGETLLPEPVARRVRAWPRPIPVGLGGYDAFRYEVAPGRRRLRMYVIPSVATGRDIVIACLLPASADVAQLMENCDRAAAGVRIDDARSYSRAAARAYAKRVRTVLEDLDDERPGLRRKLAAARTSKGQAKVAGTLADLHAEFADRARGLTYEPPLGKINGVVVRALDDAAEAYEDLAEAAEERDRDRFEAERDAVAASERGLQRPLDRLAVLISPR